MVKSGHPGKRKQLIHVDSGRLGETRVVTLGNWMGSEHPVQGFACWAVEFGLSAHEGTVNVCDEYEMVASSV